MDPTHDKVERVISVAFSGIDESLTAPWSRRLKMKDRAPLILSIRERLASVKSMGSYKAEGHSARV
jgi:hypothetical protein